MLEAYLANHLASTHVRWHLLEQRLLAIKHANASGAIDLMPAESKEIAIQSLHINCLMWGGLSGIDQHRHIVSMRRGYYFLNRIRGSEHVGNGRNRYQTRAAIKQSGQSACVQETLVCYRAHAELDRYPALKELPRHYVGVVLHLGDDNLVAFA